EGGQSEPGRSHYPLAPGEQETDGRSAPDRSPYLEAPQLFAGGRVECVEVPVIVTGKHQSRRRRHDAAGKIKGDSRRIGAISMLPPTLAGCRIDGAQYRVLIPPCDQRATAARHPPPHRDRGGRLSRFPYGAGFVRRDEKQTPDRVE